ncbi:hypothetical protein [Saccharopolyspora spinosa]|uniref:Cytidine/deoxycytidylate deaminase-like protein n=1 Tax=Saccharopolyspora spinosa TaxID=60894 RepID=A0A2N3Y4R2_SACSN|nr:hypothetical protein [Saccharopolyspora spinosa]PKW17922.1 hypothetical protein A8926_5951 [Saccharopolyspora spinosa]
MRGARGGGPEPHRHHQGRRCRGRKSQQGRPDQRSLRARTEHLTGTTIYLLAHPCPMCLGSLYYCSPDEVVFLTTRDAYEPHYVDDRKFFERDTFYGEFARNWDERRLPMRY